MNNSDLILKKYNKKFLLPVYSGTLAIEGVLKSLRLDSHDKVLISNSVCYSILQAIINSNLVPVIAIPNNGITLTKQELEKIVRKENIKVFIAVHQFGFEQEIIKNKDLIVIEDISQAWNLKPNNGCVGELSDYIVCSLGKTKPLSNGIGGLIMSNNNFINNFDVKTKECRNSDTNILEYFYPLDINYKKLIRKANKKVVKQRKNVIRIKKIFKKYSFINDIYEKNSIPCYHRYPIYLQDDKYDDFIKLLDKCKINYQKDYKNKLDSINITKSKKIKVVGLSNISKCILIKANNKYFNIKKLGYEMRKYYEF